ncbi:Na(+)/H(+) antiporter subunit C [Streptosporangium sp. NPDC000239]|uniref:Na(+)/H(+) antiporter subunit C n=1 Tax=Streptosporangium jomthongense TaxID=1193683 RepID=A0ABV8F2E4_9ACTN
MTVSLVPFAASGTMVAAGVALLLERSLVRLLVGVILLGNGVNLLIVLTGGPAGEPPILGVSPVERMADPLPQAMVLTSLVITLGVTAFLLAMVHRSWQLTGGDEVQDDTEDRRVRLRARRGELARSVLARREAYRRLVRQQRAELARLDEARRERERRDAEEASKEGGGERAARLRAEFARREREQAARERRIRRRLRERRRQARAEMREAIRQDRERQARAQDPELEGDD